MAGLPSPKGLSRVKASEIAYEPVGLALGAVSGMAAGALCKQTRKMLGHDEDAPDATDEERSWREVLLAATLQGAIFAGVKAAAGRRRHRRSPPYRNLARPARMRRWEGW